MVVFGGGLLIGSHIVLLSLCNRTRMIYENKPRTIPSGPMRAGIVLSQKVLLPVEVEEAEGMCVDVFFSTYGRTNDSHVRITLRQAEIERTRHFSTSGLVDNSFERTCFGAHRFQGGAALLTITGEDGVRGNSVAVGLTRDSPFGTATIDGRKGDKGLRLRVAVSEQLPLVYWTSGGAPAFWIFVMAYLCSASVLFARFFAQTGKTCPQREQTFT